MSVTEIIQATTLLVVIISGLFMPFLWRCLNRQTSERAATRAELEKRLDHIDECVDELKKEVAKLLTDMTWVRNDRVDR